MMRKNSIQWLSALALLVMSALMFTACSSDDNDDNGGSPDNSKILGTWVLTQISSSGEEGPRVGAEMTFYANGKFTSGSRDEGTYTYDSSTGAFNAQMNSMTITGNMKVDGNVCTGTVKVTSGGQTATYTMTLAKKGSEEAGGNDGDDDDDTPSADVKDTRMVGSWLITMDGEEGDGNMKGQTAQFKANGTWTIASQSGTYTTETDDKDRIRFNLYQNGRRINEGKLVLVSMGNVLNGEYWLEGGGEHLGLVMRKPNYTYPSDGIKGRWLMKSSSVSGPPVGAILVFGNNGEFYIEGDPHVESYSYSGNTLTIHLDEDGPMSGTLSISGKTATFVMDMGGQTATIILEKQ